MTKALETKAYRPIKIKEEEKDYKYKLNSVFRYKMALSLYDLGIGGT